MLVLDLYINKIALLVEAYALFSYVGKGHDWIHAVAESLELTTTAASVKQNIS